jgi:extracellular factor (EF) 3-hydroxypalmitic acid methyl ester biosynthesis protein
MNRAISDRVRDAAKELIASCSAARDYPVVAAALDRCVGQLDALGLRGIENRLPSSELWNVAGAVLERGWLQTRARTKPRGYAGDHELLDWIYSERVTDDPLGKLFDRYFQGQAAPRAVRNRMGMITEWIARAARESRDGLHVAIVGSAAGWEIKAALERLDQRQRAKVRVTLLDLDPAATEFGRALLGPCLAGERLVAKALNLFRLPDRPRDAALLEGVDLLFCPGLFDYLNDEGAAGMLDTLYQSLTSQGRLIVFQFDPHNPTRAYMEWIGNWYLTYRNTAELERIVASSAARQAEVRFGAEAQGIDLFVSLTKP